MRRGEAGAPSPLRFGAARPGASTGRRARRLIGAPTAPPPPRCAIRPRARRSSRGSAFVASRSAAWRRRGEWDLVCAVFNVRGVKMLGVEMR